MHYKESNSLDFTNALPQNTYTEGKYFEFTVDGKNTNTLYDIVYDGDGSGSNSYIIESDL